MRGRRRTGGPGFTLIELMIVVAIIGILSVLAVYGVRKYVANTKTTEARNALGRMANAAITAYERESMEGSVMPTGSTANLSRQLCKGASVPVPANTGLIKGTKYQSSEAEWAADANGNSGFACLHFTIDQPQYYMYSYISAGTGSVGDSFLATANGDLNGDGILSTFEITGKINGSYALNVAPNMIVSNPEE